MSKSTKWFIFNLSNILKNLKNQNETQNEGWTVTVIDHHTKDPMDLANSSITTTEGTITEVSEGQIQDSKSPLKNLNTYRSFLHNDMASTSTYNSRSWIYN